MALGVWGALGLVALALSGPGDAPLAWSPDGEWLAYAVAVHPLTAADGPRWLFPPDAADDQDEPERPSAPVFRLWATRVESAESVLLEESRGPLSAPCWSPDGKALAFARIVPEGRERARYEVVVQESTDRQRVVFSRTLSAWSALGEVLGALAPAWSPDGRFLAVPLPQQTLDLGIVRADNGRLLKVFDDSYWPAWSPDGKGPQLAFVRGREPQALQCVDAAFGAPRTLLELGQTSQAPVWLDGNALAVAARFRARRGMAPHDSPQFQLVRVAADGGAVHPLAPLRLDPADPGRPPRGGSFSFDREAENLFFTHESAARAFEIVWNRPRHSEIYKRDNPFDFTVPLGALAVSPGDRYLGLRAGATRGEALPAVLILAEDHYEPSMLIPDDETRVRWVTTLADAARRLLLAGLPPAKFNAASPGAPKAEQEVRRPTVLPLPGEVPSNNELAFRLRKLGRLGRPLCDRPADSAPAEPGVVALLEEARLFFDYLRRDFDAALASLDTLEARTTDPDTRLRLLSLRAQIYVSQGRGEEARETIAYLRERDRGTVERVEETPLGLELEPIPDPRRGWPNYLAQRAEAYLKAVQKPKAAEDEDGHNPFGNRNPDAADAALFDGPIIPRRPPGFPFAPPGQAPRLDGAPDVVLPPGGMIAPPAPAPAPARPGMRRARPR